MLLMVEQLPSESATVTYIRNSIPEDELPEHHGDAEKAPWSSTDSLIATLIDEIRYLSWLYAQAHSKNKLPRPQPMARPGVKASKTKRKVMTASELKAIDPRLRDMSDEDALARYRELTGRA